jgi:hypothetical protein
LGVIDRKLTTYDYTAKIDYNLGTKHQFEGSVFGDPSHSPMTSTSPQHRSRPRSRRSQRGEQAELWHAHLDGRYNGTLSPNWAVTVNYSNYYNSFTNTPLLNGYEITDNTAVQLGTGGAITYGGIGFNEASVSKVNQMAVSSTHIFRLWGGHNITYGYQFEDDQFIQTYGYTGAPFTLPNIPALGAAAGQTSTAVYSFASTRELPALHPSC